MRRPSDSDRDPHRRLVPCGCMAAAERARIVPAVPVRHPSAPAERTSDRPPGAGASAEADLRKPLPPPPPRRGEGEKKVFSPSPRRGGGRGEGFYCCSPSPLRGGGRGEGFQRGSFLPRAAGRV